MGGQRELEQDAGDRPVSCQFIECRGYVFLGGVFGEAAVVVLNSCLLGEPAPAADVNLGGGVVPDEDRRMADGSQGLYRQ